MVDGDPNRSATGWAKRGALPLKIVDLMQAPMHSRNYEHVVIDTAARPSREDLEALADGCNLVGTAHYPRCTSNGCTYYKLWIHLKTLGSDRYRVLLTIIPPAPRQTGQQAREALSAEGIPLFKQGN